MLPEEILLQVISIIKKIACKPELVVNEATHCEVGEFRELDDINALLVCITEKLK